MPIIWMYITGGKGEVENAYAYDAFGNLRGRAGELQNRILYTGQQYDQELGRYYLRARYYNPTIGRFTQEDVYRSDGLNLYAYCANNPVTYYDPSSYDADCNGKDKTQNPDEEPRDGYRVSDERRNHILEGDDGDPGSGHGPNRNSRIGAFLIP